MLVCNAWDHRRQAFTMASRPPSVGRSTSPTSPPSNRASRSVTPSATPRSARMLRRQSSVQATLSIFYLSNLTFSLWIEENQFQVWEQVLSKYLSITSLSDVTTITNDQLTKFFQTIKDENINTDLSLKERKFFESKLKQLVRDYTEYNSKHAKQNHFKRLSLSLGGPNDHSRSKSNTPGSVNLRELNLPPNTINETTLHNMNSSNNSINTTISTSMELDNDYIETMKEFDECTIKCDKIVDDDIPEYINNNISKYNEISAKMKDLFKQLDLKLKDFLQNNDRLNKNMFTKNKVNLSKIQQNYETLQTKILETKKFTDFKTLEAVNRMQSRMSEFKQLNESLDDMMKGIDGDYAKFEQFLASFEDMFVVNGSTNIRDNASFQYYCKNNSKDKKVKHKKKVLYDV